VDTLPRLLLLYVHLIATCVALGALISTDVQLLRRIARVDFRIAPPNPMVRVLTIVSLILACATGVLLITDGLRVAPSLSANPKLFAKVVLVGLLVVNAFVLHAITFPRLARGSRIKPWAPRWAFGVGLPIAASHALWLFVAFLGIARPWNRGVSAAFVFEVAAVLVVVLWIATMAVLHVAARQQQTRRRLGASSSRAPFAELAAGAALLQSLPDAMPMTLAHAVALTAIRPADALAELPAQPLLHVTATRSPG
jgi:hypothetical protein